MRIEETGKQILTMIESLLLIGERAIVLAKSLSFMRQAPPAFSYENLSLDFELDLADYVSIL